MLQFILTLLLPLVKLAYSLSHTFPCGYVLAILLGESYRSIRALMDLSMCVKYTNKLSSAVAGETVAELTTNLA
jgi:hypothetical protein